MKKIFLVFVFIVSVLISLNLFSEKEEVSKFKERCFQFEDGAVQCGMEKLSFGGESVRTINPDFYHDSFAFWILDTINSYDCSRIKKAIDISNDEDLKKYFELNLKICLYEVKNGNRHSDLNIVTGPYDPYAWFKDFFEEGVEFSAPMGYA